MIGKTLKTASSEQKKVTKSLRLSNWESKPTNGIKTNEISNQTLTLTLTQIHKPHQFPVQLMIATFDHNHNKTTVLNN